MPAFLVIGTGRSGTSLITQALNALGVLAPEDEVPASENNLRGTGESIAIRDQMFTLNRDLGTRFGFRPDHWRETDHAKKTCEWLTNYLSTQDIAAGEVGFSIKFPLSSIFLPMWLEAAERAGIPLNLIWATRSPTSTVASLMRSYNHTPNTAARIWGQRTYYLLRDAPDETLLMPFEGWRHDPKEQVAALSQIVGVESETRKNAAIQAFRAPLQHASSDKDIIPEACKSPCEYMEKEINGVKSTLSECIDRTTTEHLRFMVQLADAVRVLSPHFSLTTDETEARLALLRRLEHEKNDETEEMKNEIDVLSQRIREVGTLNRELTKSLEKQTHSKETDPSDPNKHRLNARLDVMELLERLEAANYKIHELSQKLSESDALRRQSEISHNEAEKNIDSLSLDIKTAREEKDSAIATCNEIKRAYQRLIIERDTQEEKFESAYRHRLNAAETQFVNTRRRVETLIQDRDKISAKLKRKDHQQSELQKSKKSLANIKTQLSKEKLNSENLKREIKEHARINSELRMSTSWRITAPLRGLKRIFQRTNS